MPSEKALARLSARQSKSAIAHHHGDDASDSDWDSDSTVYDSGLPTELDDPYPYIFEKNQEVWIKTVGGHWCSGRVLPGSPKLRQTRQKEGYYWRVVFGFGDKDNLRKEFAPLNGEIKPDDAHTRKLLKAEGWLA